MHASDKYVHSLHHRNMDPEPFSGMTMHPVEHLYYFSNAFIPSFYLAGLSPLIFLWNFTCVATCGPPLWPPQQMVSALGGALLAVRWDFLHGMGLSRGCWLAAWPKCSRGEGGGTSLTFVGSGRSPQLLLALLRHTQALDVRAGSQPLRVRCVRAAAPLAVA
jgi:hypothetical protein